MFECLVKHGCTDLSMTIDPDGYSASAIASGGFGDVWQARMMDGTLVAVKCLRLHTILEGDKKGMKVRVSIPCWLNIHSFKRLVAAYDAGAV